MLYLLMFREPLEGSLAQATLLYSSPEMGDIC